MSRNDRSATLVAKVAKVSSLSFGLAVALSQSPDIKDLRNGMVVGAEKGIQDGINHVSNIPLIKQIWNGIENIFHSLNNETTKGDKTHIPSKTNGNNPNHEPGVPPCEPPDPKENDDNKVASYQACLDIYSASLLAVKTEIFKTAHQASQERLEKVSSKAAKKKQQELLAAGIVVSTGATVAIAKYAVANSAN